jgi:hypothetical protein
MVFRHDGKGAPLSCLPARRTRFSTGPGGRDGPTPHSVPRDPEVARELGLDDPDAGAIPVARDWLEYRRYITRTDIGLSVETFTITPEGQGWIEHPLRSRSDTSAGPTSPERTGLTSSDSDQPQESDDRRGRTEVVRGAE